MCRLPISGAYNVKYRDRHALPFSFDHECQIYIIEHDNLRPTEPVRLHPLVVRDGFDKAFGNVAGDCDRFPCAKSVACQPIL
jgi:hypothetical protein